MLDQINQLFSSIDQLRSIDIDAHIEHLSQQLDQLRLLRQIVVIREESQLIGSRAVLPTDMPVNGCTGLTNGANGQHNTDTVNDVPAKSVIPAQGTNAWKMYQALLKHKELSFSELGNYVPRGSLSKLINTRLVQGMIIKVGRGRYRLRDQFDSEVVVNIPKEIVANSPEEEAPALVPKTKEDLLPREGTIAWKIYQLLLERGEMTHGNIKLATGLNDVGNTFDKYVKNGLFEKTGWGRYRIRRPPVEGEGDFDTIKPSEKVDIPLEGNGFLVAAYLQRNQPSKPAIIAADLKLSLSQVVLVLQSHSCFEMNGRGWVLKKGVAQCD